MTREEAREYAAIMQAWGDGKTIQFKVTGGEWTDSRTPEKGRNDLCFDFDNTQYRIKPEPRRFWIIDNTPFRSYDDAKRYGDETFASNKEIIEVVEVLK